MYTFHTTFTSWGHLKFHISKYGETSTAKIILSYGRYSVVGVFKNDSKQIFGTILIIVIIIITDQILYSFMVEVEILVDSFILFHYELVKDESPQKKNLLINTINRVVQNIITRIYLITKNWTNVFIDLKKYPITFFPTPSLSDLIFSYYDIYFKLLIIQLLYNIWLHSNQYLAYKCVWCAI